MTRSKQYGRWRPMWAARKCTPPPAAAFDAPALNWSPLSKEGAQQGGALLGEDARGNFDAVIEPGIVSDLVKRAHGTGLGIVAAIDQPADAGQHRRPGAHGAGLHRNVEGRARKTIVLETSGGPAQCHYLGVGRGIVIRDGAVESRSDEFLPEYHRSEE